MDILLIGNGFDLAHGLPTKYHDFLDFIRIVKDIVIFNKKCEKIKGESVNSKMKELLIDKRDTIYDQRKMWKELVEDNLWINYFLDQEDHLKDHWIDFEKEISEVIKDLEKAMENKVPNDLLYHLNINNRHLKPRITEKYYLSPEEVIVFQNLSSKGIITYQMWKDRLLTDLHKLIRALEIYLTDFVEQMEIEEFSPDIWNIVADQRPDQTTGRMVTFCKVLNFNYTNTYLKVYLSRYKEKRTYENFSKHIDYIHGKAQADNKMEANNMVLGIDEYLSKKKRNKYLFYIGFKKYFQRIHKQTGCKYKDWIDQIKKTDQERKERISILQRELKRNQGKEVEGYHTREELNKLKKAPKHHLYIFGHSLDITDKDILKELILYENVNTTIFYPDQDELGRKISNLVEIIGQKELIRRTGGDVATIKFVPQKKMQKLSSL